MPPLKDLSGMRFGRLLVICQAESRNNSNQRNKCTRWNCVCDCGAQRTVFGSSLRGGLTTSCGCYHREVVAPMILRTHGGSYTGEYSSWKHMRRRCDSPKEHGFKTHGGRGIKVCARWIDSFVNFLEDMGPKPTPKHSIDRIDNDGHYEPSNCRWATAKQQQENIKHLDRRYISSRRCKPY